MVCVSLPQRLLQADAFHLVHVLAEDVAEGGGGSVEEIGGLGADFVTSVLGLSMLGPLDKAQLSGSRTLF